MHKDTYSGRLLDPRWQQLRLRVFERDNWACRNCGKKEKTLNAHHVHYHPHAAEPWDYDLETIITLCSDCHAEEHISFEASKANLILALAKKGHVLTYDFDRLVDLIEKDGCL